MKFKWDDDDQKYVKLGITAFIVVVLCILANQVLHQLPLLTVGVVKLIGCLRSIIYGLIFAYLLTPLLNLVEKPVMKALGGFGKRTRMVRGISVIVTWGITLLMIVILMNLIIPELIDSVEGILSNMPVYVNQLTRWVGKLLKDNPEIRSRLIVQIRTLYSDFNTILDSINEIMPNISEFVGNLYSGVFNAVSGAFKFILGIIVSIYVMSSKEKFVAQAKKLVYSLFPVERANRMADIARLTHRKFGGFFIGKIIDSIAIGILCFILLSIFKIPYSVLVSFIVGITNIIPFFGPFIGAVPCAVILLLANPVKCLYFIIIIVVLQQLDGNILGPKILGSSIGISSFWVMFAILVFGGMFGFWGLICGVPLFAVVYDVACRFVNHRLRGKELPTATDDYRRLEYVDPQTNEIINFKEKDDKNVSQGK